MSRSRRKTPIIAHTKGGFKKGEANDKTIAAGVERSNARNTLKKGDEPAPEHRHRRSGQRLFQKDGKQWLHSDLRTYGNIGK